MNNSGFRQFNAFLISFVVTAILLLASTGSYATSYIFFLHNKFVEEYPTEAVHPQFGKCDYFGILTALKRGGNTVISEIRPKNTDARIYAGKVKHQIDSLMQMGIKASEITVIGTSKGGYIAREVSMLLKNKEVAYVFIGCCSDGETGSPSATYYGHILSIYEQSDAFHSCGAVVGKAVGNVPHFKEIALNTGLSHGFLFRPLDEWVKPALLWAQRKY